MTWRVLCQFDKEDLRDQVDKESESSVEVDKEDLRPRLTKRFGV